MDELATKLNAVLTPALAEGERLIGACVASEQKGWVGGRMVAIGITEGRLIVQGANRRWESDGDPISLPPEAIAAAKAEGAGGGWAEFGAAIMDKLAVKLQIRTTAGEKLKFSLMRATGPGPLGGLGGGETQRQGVEALAAFFAAAGK